MSIFNLFGRRDIQYNDDIEDSEQEDQEDQEDQDVIGNNKISIFDNPLYSTIWKSPQFQSHIIVDIYMLSAREIIPYLTSWSFNREINIEHTVQIKNSLIEQKAPYLMGSIQIAKDINSQYRVINGQHRLNALSQIIKDDIDMKFDIKCIFEIFSLNINDITNPTLDETSIIETLFKVANSSLNFDKKDSVDSFCRDIIFNLRNEQLYKNNIVDTQKTVYRPSITLKEFYENLKKYLPKSLYERKVEEVTLLIKKKNNELSRINPNDLYKNAKKSVKQYEKALNKRFFLNLSESRYGPDRWISELED
jgi:hypothetical protein